jgi:serine-type D-Ala-D-Ala carboxypeptidase (penicillin-binding protein 5/6)
LHRRLTNLCTCTRHIGRRTDEGIGHRVASLLLVFALLFSAVAPASLLAKPQPTDLVDARTATQLGLQLEALPDVAMKSGVLVTEDGQILWERAADERRSIASITKIMTAIIIFEQEDLEREVTIPAEVARVSYASLFMQPGVKVGMEHLLNAMLVRSGNDAAMALAVHVAGSEEAFVEMMNAKAAELGLKNTRFSNPHGLDLAGQNQYSSAHDVAVLARYAMTKPEFREIVAKPSVTVDTGRGTETLENTNLLLGQYEGVTGVKTGWTNSAGYCVVDSAERDGYTLYAVVLGTNQEQQRFRDARELLDWGFAHYRSQVLVSEGTVVGQASVIDYLDMTVDAQVAEDRIQPIFDIVGPVKRDVTVSSVKAPLRKGDRVGIATFTQDGNIIATVPLVAAVDVAAPNVFERIGIFAVRLWRKAFGGQLVAPPVSSPAVS